MRGADGAVVIGPDIRYVRVTTSIDLVKMVSRLTDNMGKISRGNADNSRSNWE